MTAHTCLRGSLVAVVVVLLSSPGSVAGQSPVAVTVDDVMRVTNLEETQISPDGSSVSYVVAAPDTPGTAYRTNIWRVGADGVSSQLTDEGGRNDTPRWSPDGQRLAFISNRGGTNQIWVMPAEGGAARQVTRLPHGVAAAGFLRQFPPYPQAFAWSPDSRQFAVLVADQGALAEEARRRADRDDTIVVGQGARTTRIHIVDVMTGADKPLTSGDLNVNHVAWSPDGREIAFSAQSRPRSEGSDPARAIMAPAGDDVYVVTVATREVRSLVSREGMDSTPKWSPDGRFLAFVSHDGAVDWTGHTFLCVVEAHGGQPRNLTPLFDEMPSFFEWAGDGAEILFLARQRLTTQLFAVPAAGGELRQVTSGQRVFGAFSFTADRQRMAFLSQDGSNPWDVYQSKTGMFEPARLTKLNPHLEGRTLAPEVVRWAGADGLEIEGLLYRPSNAEVSGPIPMVTCVHGGQGSFTLAFAPQLYEPGRFPVQAEPCVLAHVFAAHGFATFLPNPRGGFGYGRDFRHARDRGYKDFEDIMRGIDALIERGTADPERLGIMGWSYGGFMSAWAITQTDRFKASSVGAGQTNSISYFGTSANSAESIVAFYGTTPWENRERYMKHSPIEFVSRAKTPTLLQYPEKDEIVPVSQGQELHRALQLLGVQTEFAIYPREGHMLREPKQQADMLRRNLDWMRRWIPDATPAETRKY